MAWMRCCRQCPPAASAKRCLWLCSCSAFLDRSHNLHVSCQSMPWMGARQGRLLASSLILLAAAASTMIFLKRCMGAFVIDTFPKIPTRKVPCQRRGRRLLMTEAGEQSVPLVSCSCPICVAPGLQRVAQPSFLPKHWLLPSCTRHSRCSTVGGI